MQCKCPKCGSDLELTLTSPVRPTPMPLKFELTPPPTKKKPYFRTFTDVGAIRNALYDAGYEHEATNCAIYNDSRKSGRRIKIAWVQSGFTTDRKKYGKFCLALDTVFGSRVIKVGPYTQSYMHGSALNIVVELK